MSNFVFNRTETKNMKIVGIIDTDVMTIDVDGEEKSLSTLLSPFQGDCVDIKITVKNKEDLDEPTSIDDEE